ncbi:hypothetical protein L1987_21318 [Smallanthus sonchifolius]|uniref:Uncharacterized protein n=1 Tax=Smallanthus sonchifolius TaxID=185202 RepID=A0ACB9IUS3_9ASTR|nr:hypothetical protein L1987_21318 [Smallanthus sonchifolius]
MKEKCGSAHEFLEMDAYAGKHMTKLRASSCGTSDEKMFCLQGRHDFGARGNHRIMAIRVGDGRYGDLTFVRSNRDSTHDIDKDDQGDECQDSGSWLYSSVTC